MGSIPDYVYHLGLRVDPPDSAGAEAVRGLRCHDFNTEGDEAAKAQALRHHTALLQEEGVVSGSTVFGTLYRQFDILQEFPAVTKE